MLLTGKVAMSYAGQFNLLWYKQYIESGVLNLGFGVGPVLKEYSVLTSGPSVVVFKSSQHQEEALRLLEYFYDTENLMPAIQSGLWMPLGGILFYRRGEDSGMDVRRRLL